MDADFFMLFKDAETMAICPEGVLVQDKTEMFTGKLACISNVLKSYNAKLGDESTPSDEANSAANRLHTQRVLIDRHNGKRTDT